MVARARLQRYPLWCRASVEEFEVISHSLKLHSCSRDWAKSAWSLRKTDDGTSLSLRAEKLRSKVEKKWQIIHYEHFSIRGVIWEFFAQHSVPRGARRHRWCEWTFASLVQVIELQVQSLSRDYPSPQWLIQWQWTSLCWPPAITKIRYSYFLASTISLRPSKPFLIVPIPFSRTKSYLMSVADHCDIDVRLSVSLCLWNDNLGWECIFGVGQRMIKQADATHNLSHFLHL